MLLEEEKKTINSSLERTNKIRHLIAEFENKNQNLFKDVDYNLGFHRVPSDGKHDLVTNVQLKGKNKDLYSIIDNIFSYCSYDKLDPSLGDTNQVFSIALTDNKLPNGNTLQNRLGVFYSFTEECYVARFYELTLYNNRLQEDYTQIPLEDYMPVLIGFFEPEVPKDYHSINFYDAFQKLTNFANKLISSQQGGK